MTRAVAAAGPGALSPSACTATVMPYFGDVAASDPSRMAIVDPARGGVSFGELRATVGRLSNAFAREGVKVGDRIVAMMPNCREYFELRLTAEECGLYFVPVSPQLTGRELAHVLEDSRARCVFVEASALERVRDTIRGAGLTPAQIIVLDGDDAAGRSYRSFHAGLPPEAPPVGVRGEFMGYTSGTTGVPKAVRKPLRDGRPGVAAGLVGFFGQLGMSPGSGVHLAALPLYHAAPGRQAVTALHFGHTVVVAAHLSAADQLALIARYRVTTMFTVPTVIGRWLRLPPKVRDAHDLSSLKAVVHGGAPCPVEIKRAAIAWLGPIVTEFYGATEGVATAVTAAEWLDRPGTVGRAITGSSVHILDADGTELPPGTVGMVYFRPPASFEYLNDPAKTAGAHRGDLITVGDLGHLDAEGWLFLASRRGDIVISGGVNVYPAEVEGVLSGHPSVVDAAVLGIPDDDWGERVVALVVLEQGVAADDATRSGLETYCRAHLAACKVPRDIRFVDHLSRTTSGKLQRSDLPERYRSLCGGN